jgi:hypothetical protein
MAQRASRERDGAERESAGQPPQAEHVVWLPHVQFPLVHKQQSSPHVPAGLG